jgi:hypothetical protein
MRISTRERRPMQSSQCRRTVCPRVDGVCGRTPATSRSGARSPPGASFSCRRYEEQTGAEQRVNRHLRNRTDRHGHVVEQPERLRVGEVERDGRRGAGGGDERREIGIAEEGGVVERWCLGHTVPAPGEAVWLRAVVQRQREAHAIRRAGSRCERLRDAARRGWCGRQSGRRP